MLSQLIRPPVEPRADEQPADEQRPDGRPAAAAEVLGRVEAARSREREALAGLARAVQAAERRYVHASRRFQDAEAAFEARRSILLQRERHGA